jgi:hypothetical protein
VRAVAEAVVERIEDEVLLDLRDGASDERAGDGLRGPRRPGRGIGGGGPERLAFRMASMSISGPVASSTARCIAFSSSRTLPRHELRVMSRFASSVSERCGTPFRSAYFRPKYEASSNTSAGRSRKGGMRRWTTLSR